MRNPVTGGRRYFSNRYNPSRKFYFVNYKIQAQEVRLIDSEGRQVGLLGRDEALRKAQEVGLDLVLIAPNAKPPVAKITDFKKFLYQEEKKQKEAKKGAKKSDVKDIQISLFMSAHDRERFKKRAEDFLAEGHQVRLNLTLRGREIIKKPMALELMKGFVSDLANANISKEPRIEGRVIRAVVSRKK